MGIAVTATRSSTTEPMLVGDACVMMEVHDPRHRDAALVSTRGDAFVESSCAAAAARPGNFSPAAAEFHRAVLRAGAADGSRVIGLGVYLQGRYTDRDGGRI